MELSFMIIDESELDCFIARKIIENTDKSLKVITFHNAKIALTTISETPVDNHLARSIILLDLQMPIMDGFKFVEEFEKLPSTIKNNYIIIILSATMNANDISRVLAYSSVNSILDKPLTREKVYDMLMLVNL